MSGRCLYRAEALRLFREFSDNGKQPIARNTDGRDQPVERIGIAIDGGNSVPRRDQRLGHDRADAAGGTG